MDTDDGDTTWSIPSQGYGRCPFMMQSIIIPCCNNENATLFRHLRWEQQELLMNLGPTFWSWTQSQPVTCLLHVATAVRARDCSSRFPFKRWTRPHQSHSKMLRRKKKILKQRLNASTTIRRLMCEVRSQQIFKWVTSRMREKSQISPQCVQQGSGCRTDSRSQELLDGDQNGLGGGDSTFWRGFQKSLSRIISWMAIKSEWCLTYISPDTNSKAAVPLERQNHLERQQKVQLNGIKGMFYCSIQSNPTQPLNGKNCILSSVS